MTVSEFIQAYHDVVRDDTKLVVKRELAGVGPVVEAVGNWFSDSILNLHRCDIIEVQFEFKDNKVVIEIE